MSETDTGTGTGEWRGGGIGGGRVSTRQVELAKTGIALYLAVSRRGVSQS